MAEKAKERKAVSAQGSEKSPKAEALAVAMSQIEKQYGKGSIMRLGSTDKLNVISSISTGSLGLDLALGIVSAATVVSQVYVVGFSV